MVKVMLSCSALILCWAFGYGLSLLIGLPPALLGLLVLFVALVIIGHVPKDLFNVCQFLLKHFSLFFIPPLIAAWVYVDTLGQDLWLFLLAIVFSTFISLFITSWLARRFLPDEKIEETLDKGPKDHD